MTASRESCRAEKSSGWRLGGRCCRTRALLIMDEPLSALDGARKAEILPYLERLRDEAGVPILYVSHAVAEVARLATTVVVLEAGRLRRIGPAAEVLSDPEIAPVLGLREAGALISARLVAQEADGLSRLETAAGPVFLPRVAADRGGGVKAADLGAGCDDCLGAARGDFGAECAGGAGAGDPAGRGAGGAGDAGSGGGAAAGAGDAALGCGSGAGGGARGFCGAQVGGTGAGRYRPRRYRSGRD